MINKYFEDYRVGETWVSSRGRTITEADLVNFCAFSGDWYPLHADREWAARGPFGQRIAHGLLVLSAASGLLPLEPGFVLAFYGMDRLRFTAPTYIGDTIRLELTVTDKEPKDDARGVVTLEQRVRKQTGELVLVGSMKLLVPRRTGERASVTA